MLAKKDEGLKATTLNLYNSAIRFFYRNVLHILWDDITVPRMILEHKLPTVLTNDEIDRLLEAVTISNTKLCLQRCILPECVFLKSSICIMMIFPAQICRFTSGTRRTGWIVTQSFPSGVWISLHNTGLRKDVPVEFCFLINSPVIYLTVSTLEQVMRRAVSDAKTSTEKQLRTVCVIVLHTSDGTGSRTAEYSGSAGTP